MASVVEVVGKGAVTSGSAEEAPLSAVTLLATRTLIHPFEKPHSFFAALRKKRGQENPPSSALMNRIGLNRIELDEAEGIASFNPDLLQLEERSNDVKSKDLVWVGKEAGEESSFVVDWSVSSGTSYFALW